MTLEETTAGLNAVGQGRLPGKLGMTFEAREGGEVAGGFDVQPDHLAPNGFLHAASIVALVDTAAGYGCFLTKPPEATGFTTVELKANFLGTVTSGRVEGVARLAHGGRTTQVWDGVVTGGGKTLALFRCTQLFLFPRTGGRDA